MKRVYCLGLLAREVAEKMGLVVRVAEVNEEKIGCLDTGPVKIKLKKGPTTY